MHISKIILIIFVFQSISLICFSQEKPKYYDGHKGVDLGLSVIWATQNLDALDPQSYGYTYAWGETTPKRNFVIDNYKYQNKETDSSIGRSFTKYNGEDKKTVLDLEDDAANSGWGGRWRMPTKEELEELLNNCTIEEQLYFGVNVLKFTAQNGNYIYIPKGHLYNGYRFEEESKNIIWTSTLSDDDVSNPCTLYWKSHTIAHRWQGLPIRPVIKVSTDEAVDQLPDLNMFSKPFQDAASEQRKNATDILAAQYGKSEANRLMSGDFLWGDDMDAIMTARYYATAYQDNESSPIGRVTSLYYKDVNITYYFQNDKLVGIKYPYKKANWIPRGYKRTSKAKNTRKRK